MWTIEKLKKRFGMSDQQMYRRIQAAQKPLGEHIKRGEKNCIELSEGGFSILENVIELEKQGKTLATAVREVEVSVCESPIKRFEVFDSTAPISGRVGHKPPKAGFHSLIQEVGYLKGVLESKNERLSELKGELERVRLENDNLRRSANLGGYRASQRRWQWWPWR